jgi:hypothetical protein
MKGTTKFNPIQAIQRAVCVGIGIGSEYDCTIPLKSGVSERLLVGNLKDIETFVYSTTPGEETVIENIIMKSGTSMYAFDGVRASVKPQVNLIATDITVGFGHQVDFSVFEVDSSQKNNLQGMSAVKQFAIYQNPKDVSLGDSVWEVLGVNAGMNTTVVTRIAGDAASGGAYTVTLLTPETSSETGLPNSFWDTDIATTEALIDALLQTAP